MNADQQKQFEEWWASQEHFASKYRAAERAYAAAKSSDAATIRELREALKTLRAQERVETLEIIDAALARSGEGKNGGGVVSPAAVPDQPTG